MRDAYTTCVPSVGSVRSYGCVSRVAYRRAARGGSASVSCCSEHVLQPYGKGRAGRRGKFAEDISDNVCVGTLKCAAILNALS